MKSGKYSLHLNDWAKGLLMAIGTAFFSQLTMSLNSGELPTISQLKISAIAGLSAGLFYVAKNFLTPTNTVAIKQIQKAGGDVVTFEGDKVPTLVKKPIAPDM